MFCKSLEKIPDKFPSVIQKSLQTLNELLQCWHRELKIFLDGDSIPDAPLSYHGGKREERERGKEKDNDRLSPQDTAAPVGTASTTQNTTPPFNFDDVVESVEQKGLFFLANADPFVRKASLEILRVTSELSVSLVRPPPSPSRIFRLSSPFPPPPFSLFLDRTRIP